MTNDREQLEKRLLTGEDLLKLDKKVHLWSLYLCEFTPFQAGKPTAILVEVVDLVEDKQQSNWKWGGGRGCLWK